MLERGIVVYPAVWHCSMDRRSAALAGDAVGWTRGCKMQQRRLRCSSRYASEWLTCYGPALNWKKCDAREVTRAVERPAGRHGHWSITGSERHQRLGAGRARAPGGL